MLVFSFFNDLFSLSFLTLNNWLAEFIMQGAAELWQKSNSYAVLYLLLHVSAHTWFVDQPTVKNIDTSPIKSASEKCYGGGHGGAKSVSFFLSFI